MTFEPSVQTVDRARTSYAQRARSITPRDLAGRDLFAHVAPFLERCHRERREELAEARTHIASERKQEAKLERLVAHRELQLVRAGFVGDRRYLKHRQRKLDWARKELARIRSHIEMWEAA